MYGNDAGVPDFAAGNVVRGEFASRRGQADAAADAPVEPVVAVVRGDIVKGVLAVEFAGFLDQPRQEEGAVEQPHRQHHRRFGGDEALQAFIITHLPVRGKLFPGLHHETLFHFAGGDASLQVELAQDIALDRLARPQFVDFRLQIVVLVFGGDTTAEGGAGIEFPDPVDFLAEGGDFVPGRGKCAFVFAGADGFGDHAQVEGVAPVFRTRDRAAKQQGAVGLGDQSRFDVAQADDAAHGAPEQIQRGRCPRAELRGDFEELLVQLGVGEVGIENRPAGLQKTRRRHGVALGKHDAGHIAEAGFGRDLAHDLDVGFRLEAEQIGGEQV